MALNNNFYEEIFNKERYWIDLANRKLLNIYYLNGPDGLREFYVSKKEKLESEIGLSQNQVLSNFIEIIIAIIDEIDSLTNRYRNGDIIDANSISKIFITTQMSNTGSVKKNNGISSLDALFLKKQVLEALRDAYKSNLGLESLDEEALEVCDKQKVA